MQRIRDAIYTDKDSPEEAWPLAMFGKDSEDGRKTLTPITARQGKCPRHLRSTIRQR